MMLGFLFGFAGAVLLSLSMKKHFRQVFVDKPLPVSSSRVLRGAGYVLLATSVWACVEAKGAGLGLTWFAGLLTVAVFSVALLLPLLDRRIN